MTDNRYPEESELEELANFAILDKTSLNVIMETVKELWNYADFGYWKQEGNVYTISTGGWSGNEDIIEALMKNHAFWLLFFYQSTRGGHYVFCPSSEAPHD